jgi:hypothetical protein
VSDDDIAALADTYAPGRRGSGSGGGGQVVDLPPVDDGDGEAGAA